MEHKNTVHEHVIGGIIHIVPTPASSFRLSPRIKRTLERLARQRGKSMSEVLELAISHLDGTLRNGLPIYLDEPDNDRPNSHKAAASGR
jgi:hypothetical protein